MATVNLDLDLYACFNDDLDVDVYLFQGQKDEEAAKITYVVADMAEEFVACRSDFRTGLLAQQFVGDADCLAQRLRYAAEILERAVEKAYQEG